MLLFSHFSVLAIASFNGSIDRSTLLFRIEILQSALTF